jgi:membrane protease YdiL (CAAX protease family)
MSSEKGQPILFLIFIFAAIVLFQYIFTFSNVGHGILLSLLLTLIVYVLISVVRMQSELIRSAESLSLIPLYVLFTSSMPWPWFFVEQQLLLPMVYSLILGLCFWHMYEHDIDLPDVGIIWKKTSKYVALGALIAIPTGFIEYSILLPDPAFPAFQLKHLVKDIVYMTFFVGLGEELLFRGLIQNDLKRLFSWQTAVVAQGFLFGVMHMTWRSAPELGFTFAAGIILGYMYHRTGSLIGPIALHSVNNVMLVGILPYL